MNRQYLSKNIFSFIIKAFVTIYFPRINFREINFRECQKPKIAILRDKLSRMAMFEKIREINFREWLILSNYFDVKYVLFLQKQLILSII